MTAPVYSVEPDPDYPSAPNRYRVVRLADKAVLHTGTQADCLEWANSRLRREAANAAVTRIFGYP